VVAPQLARPEQQRAAESQPRVELRQARRWQPAPRMKQAAQPQAAQRGVPELAQPAPSAE
jgi:hypothetical protein